jgi:hypothetical protein
MKADKAHLLLCLGLHPGLLRLLRLLFITYNIYKVAHKSAQQKIRIDSIRFD